MASKTIKLMIIEDEELLLKAIAKKLTRMGFEVITCVSAKQALDYLDNMDPPPDAIWLDYYLGDMNGIEFMSNLKKDKYLAQIPVFVVSNSASEEKKNAMMAFGVKKYLLKAGHRLEDIANMIKDYIEKGGVRDE